MEENDSYPHAEVQQAKTVSKRTKISLITAGLLFAAVSIFASGWLFGTGRLSLRSNGLVPVVSNGSAPSEGIDELYRKLVDNFDGEINDEDVLNGLKRGLAASVGDPFTEFLTAEETQAFNEGLNGKFEGIGAELGKEGSFVVIVAPIKGTPAERAGLQSQDIIEKIDGEDAYDITITEAVNKIRGPKGEAVKLSIIRDGERLDVEIIRDTISIDSVESRIEGTVGIIEISRFGNDTVQLAREAALDVKAKGAKSVILDLRGNPGGLLDASVDVSAIWLNRGSTVLEEKQNGVVIQTFKTDDQPILNGVPTVILINEGSASASEIVAGALRDNDAATVIGTTSFGKGSVQRLIELSGGGSLKVTIARWFTPSGASIDKEGIKPDIEVEVTAEDIENEKDPQLDAAKERLSSGN